MLLQLVIGAIVLMLSTLIAGLGYMVLELALARAQRWALRPPHSLKLAILLCSSMLWTLMIVTAGVWLWAIALRLLGIFITMEASVYFSLVAFTTLGFGDILLPSEWRLLSGIMAINGLLMIGLLTAMLVEVLRRVRNIQTDGRDWNS